MDISTLLKKQRARVQLSQAKLAARAQVSLATVQNIESGRANPSWDTVMSLCKILSLDIRFSRRSISDYLDELAALGCPLMSRERDGDTFGLKPTRVELEQSLRSIHLYRFSRANERDRAAVMAWLCAIRDHYPSLWECVLPAVKRDLARQSDVSIKLRRIALARLGDFL